MQLLLLLSYLLSFVWSVIGNGQGVIVQPSDGTAIFPGKPFNFQFSPHNGPCSTSYNFSVFLSTTPPDGFAQSSASGQYLGRFSLFPIAATSNPPPAQLFTPNFGKAPGGFGAGATAVMNLPIYLIVIDEFTECGSNFGTKFGVSFNNLIYNATRTGAPKKKRSR